jgi:uroporphyrinogen-III decarboxylase
LVSPETYRDLFKPFHTLINTWVHHNTPWKTFTHTCGGVRPLLEDFVEAGFDLLNPVQVSAEGMDAAELKRDFGDRLTFWGGGADTQKTLPFGTPEEVKREVLARLEIFAPGGGYVFNPIHNLQPNTPVENVLAMFEAVREFNG